jgi:hypothetical protein
MQVRTGNVWRERSDARFDIASLRRERTLEATSTRRTVFVPTPASHLSGRVLDLNGRWVDDAEIVLPRHELRTKTSDGGRFRLPALPTQAPTTLVVSAHGRQQEYQLVQAGGRAAGVVIQFGY